MDESAELAVSSEIVERNIFGSLPDSRLVQRDFALRFPLDTGKVGKLKNRSEGRSHPSTTPESLFPYYLNNYEVTKRHLEELTRELGRPIRVLEIGCGTGWGSRFLSDNLPGSEVVATNRVLNEKDREILDTARSTFSKDGLTFEEADATKLGEQYSQGDFDAVVMLEVIEHIPQEEHSRVFQQVAEVLKPGGAILISTPSGEGYGQTKSGPQSKDHVWIYGSRRDVETELSPSFVGLEVNRIVNRTHTQTFGRNAIRQHFYSLGFIKAPESMFGQYKYEKGNNLIDDKHVREQDTSTWIAVARKPKEVS